MKRRKKEGNLFLGIIVAVLVLGVGYAAITGVNLIINGSATAKASGQQSDFNVHFDDLVSTENYITYVETAEEDSLAQSFVDSKNVTASSSETDKAASIAISNDSTSATVTVSNLTTVGDTVTLTLPVINESDGIKANFTASVVNNKEEYFNVTAAPAVDTLNGNGATTTLLVTVAVTDVPKVNDVEGTFTVTLHAEPEE